jgi:heme exporter protein CcmD
MTSLGPHGSYIIASYMAAGVILGWMILSSLFANRRAARRLAAIEAQEARS